MASDSSKKTRTRKKKRTTSGDDSGRFALPDRRVLMAVGVIVVGVALSVGIVLLDRHVKKLPQVRDVVVRLSLKDQPEWMAASLRDQILNKVSCRVNAMLQNQQDAAEVPAVLHPHLTSEIGRALGDDPWVAQVNKVQVFHDGRVELDCRFREPLAMVSVSDGMRLVDKEAVVLPGTYSVAELVGTDLMMICGIQQPPSAAGTPWPGQDLQDALTLLAQIDAQAWRDQIQAIDMSNHAGRISPADPQIVLATVHDGSKILWGRPVGKEMRLENTAQQKIALLNGIYDKYPRIDLGRPYVDVRRASDEVDVPAETRGDTDIMSVSAR